MTAPCSLLRHPLVVWGSAVLVYIVAIAGRTSFGVAGLLAIERFHINAGTLSLFTVIQLGVYAGAQIPVGMALDRIGPRRVLVCGALLMAFGQVMLGLSPSLGVALAARVLIGFGDATAFASVLRLVPLWFTPRQIPLFTQLTGILGALGQVISSFPFAFALHRIGWGFSFSALAVAGVLTAVCAWIVLRATPSLHSGPARNKPAPGELVLERHVEGGKPTVRETLREPGTWLAFWAHFSTCCPTVVFPLLWGVPYLEIVNGWSPEVASGILVVQTIAGLAAGPMVAHFVARHPLRRSWIVLVCIGLTVVLWIAILALPGPTPGWMVVALLVLYAFDGAASAVAFDFARTSIDPRRLSTATGVANMGGFSAALIVAWLIGIFLDALAPDGVYTPADFKVAFASQVVVLLVGVVGILHYRKATRAQLAEEGVVVPPLREAIERWRSAH